MLNRNENSINIDDYFPFSVLRMVTWCPRNLSQDKLDVAFYHLDTFGSLKLNIKKLRSWDSAPSFMANRRRKGGSSDRFLHLSL